MQKWFLKCIIYGMLIVIKADLQRNAWLTKAVLRNWMRDAFSCGWKDAPLLYHNC